MADAPEVPANTPSGPAPTPNDAAAAAAKNSVENTAGTERTFTQADVDKIVGERIAGVKAKYADYDEIKTTANAAAATAAELDQTKAALAEAQGTNLRQKVATEHGVPVELLHGTTEDELTASATALAAFAATGAKPGAVVKSVGSDADDTVGLHTDAGARLILGL